MTAATRRQVRQTLAMGGLTIGALLAGALVTPDAPDTVLSTVLAAHDVCAGHDGPAYEYLTQADPADLASVEGITVFEDGTASVDCDVVLWGTTDPGDTRSWSWYVNIVWDAGLAS